jgi:hypothetical protein
MQLKKSLFFIVFYLYIHQAFGQFNFPMNLAFERNYYSHFDEFSDKHKARLQRYYFGIGRPFMNIDVATHYVSPAYSATPPVAAIDAKQETMINMANGFGGMGGAFYPLMRTGAESAIGFDISASCFFYTYNIGPLNYGSTATFSDQSLAEVIGLPIGIVYKSGGEVTLNKNNRSIISFGFGIAPTASISKIIAEQISFNTRRYVMLDVGAFTGIAWKLRVTYYAGNLLLVNKLNDPLDAVSASSTVGPPGTMDVKATGASDLNISLLILPFSMKWDK